MPVVTFDPAENLANRTKHGRALAEAVGFDFEAAIVEPDRDVHHEICFRATGRCGGRFCLLVFVEHENGDGLHAISLRPCTKHEARRYVRQV